MKIIRNPTQEKHSNRKNKSQEELLIEYEEYFDKSDLVKHFTKKVNYSYSYYHEEYIHRPILICNICNQEINPTATKLHFYHKAVTELLAYELGDKNTREHFEIYRDNTKLINGKRTWLI